MLDETREKELINLARQGDRPAFEELFQAHQERLLAMIRGKMGPAVAQTVDPEDVLQDTFVRALRSIENFQWQGVDSFRRWLEGIASHLVLDAGRKQARKKELRIDRDFEAEQTSPSKHLRRDERFERFKKALESLSPDYRTVLRLSRIEGLMIKEIAERIGRSESAVKNLLLRAAKQLRESFGDTESLHLGHRHLDNGELKHGK